MIEATLNPNPQYSREIISIVNSSPYPSHMSMRLMFLELDWATVELEIENCHLQPYGIVHGGVLSTLKILPGKGLKTKSQKFH